MRYILFLWACLVFSVTSLAVEENYQFANAQQAQLFNELNKELRCPKCQNQNIADSDAVVAKDLRDKVLTLVQQGQSKQQIIDYMVDRYGYFVHYQPPVTAGTLVLWVLPILIILFGLVFIVRRQKHAATAQTWSEQDEQQLQKLVEKYSQEESTNE